MSEENIDGHPYRIGRLNARKQWNVVRRLAPVLAASAPALQVWASASPPPETGPDGQPAPGTAAPAFDLEAAFSAFGPLATAIGDLTDENSDYVINTCLSVVHTNRIGQTWAPVANSGGDLMFQDIHLGTMVKLVLIVLRENLGDFLGALPGSTTDG